MLREYSKVKRWEQTDDVLQNAMLRLHRSLVEVKPESPRQFYGLAATQIRRELIDLARHHYSEKGIGENHETDRQDGRPRAEKAVAVEPKIWKSGPDSMRLSITFRMTKGKSSVCCGTKG